MHVNSSSLSVIAGRYQLSDHMTVLNRACITSWSLMNPVRILSPDYDAILRINSTCVSLLSSGASITPRVLYASLV